MADRKHLYSNDLENAGNEFNSEDFDFEEFERRQNEMAQDPYWRAFGCIANKPMTEVKYKDYLAALALQGILSNPNVTTVQQTENGWTIDRCVAHAVLSKVDELIGVMVDVGFDAEYIQEELCDDDDDGDDLEFGEDLELN